MDKVRRRINHGIKEVRHGPVLISDGSRHNYLPFNPFKKIEGAEFAGERMHRKFSGIGVAMYAFLVTPDIPFCLTLQTNKISHKNLDYTFSAYCAAEAELPVTLKVILSDKSERKGDYWNLTRSITRYETPHSFSDAPGIINIEISGCVSAKKFPEPFELRFAIATVEEGLFASHPIKGDTPYGFRDGDQLCHPRKGHFPEGNSGTIIVHFVPEWTGPQIAQNDKAYLFDCVSDDRANSYGIYCDGAHFGRITANIVANGVHQIIATDIIPVRGVLYSVVLRWLSGIADVIVNGRLAGLMDSITLPNPNLLGDRIYLGSTSRNPAFSSYSKLPQFSVIAGWLSDGKIKAFCYESNQNAFSHFENEWRKEENRPSLKYFTGNSWFEHLATYLLRFQRIWQNSPPRWIVSEPIDESDCRDEISRVFSLIEFDSIPELHSCYVFIHLRGDRSDLPMLFQGNWPNFPVLIS